MFSDASSINIVDSFPEEILTVPTISIDAGRIKEEHYEVGSRDRIRVRIWYIDIFAINKSQRDDFGYRILDQSKDGINIYNYNEGFPPSVTPSRIEHFDVLNISYEPIPVILDEVQPKYFRGQVIIVTQNDTV
jgi:hypothetical protein